MARAMRKNRFTAGISSVAWGMRAVALILLAASVARLTLPARSGESAPMSSPVQFSNVTAVAKANIYFDGKVVSHTLLLAGGEKKTLGVIFPGTFHFGTDKAERMEIIAGECSVKLDGQTEVHKYAVGTAFEVPAKSGFDIVVTDGGCEYVCSFLG